VNSFGPSASQQFPLVDSRCVKEHRERFRRDAFPDLALANSYYSMAGRWPDVGWLLLDRASYNLLSPYSNTFKLIIGDFINQPVTISNLSLIQARCVTRGLARDPNAIYLLQVTNNEGVLYNPWFQFPLSAQYNVRAPAYDGQYYSGSTNSGTAWTWDTMVADIWSRAASLLGNYPHLPITPTGTPENFIFIGVPLWEALSHLMDYLGLVISGNFPNFTIVVAGSADPVFTALETSYIPYLEDSMEYLDVGSGRVPSQIVVYFHRRNQFYGSEETVRLDSLQWQTTPLYSVTVAAPTQFSQAAGTAYMWADFTVRHDMNGNPLAADIATAATVAAERALQFFNNIYRGTQGFMRHVYAGCLPFSTGSLVDGVRWFNTGMLGTNDDKWCGWRTELIRGYIWEEATFPLFLKGLTGPI
jgi:hypothetical protein